MNLLVHQFMIMKKYVKSLTLIISLILVSCSSSKGSDSLSSTISSSLSSSEVSTSTITTSESISSKEDKTSSHEHIWLGWQIVTPANCTDDGEETRECMECHYVEHKTLTHYGHDYQTSTVAPKCTEQGYILHDCSRCHDQYKTDYVDPTGHSKGSSYTSIDDDKHSYECETCHETVIENHSYEVTSKTYNTFGTGGTVIYGSKTLTCSKCGHEKIVQNDEWEFVL